MIEQAHYYNKSMANVDIDLGKYSLGWSDPEKNVFKPTLGSFLLISKKAKKPSEPVKENVFSPTKEMDLISEECL